MNNKEYKVLSDRFFEYVDNYRDNDGKFCSLLEEKLNHIKRVANNAVFIAKNEKWSEEDCLIAEICGLYHDIGRFSQYKTYKTFSDAKSVNHGQQGFDIINSNNLFDILSEEDKQTVLDSVHFHNSLEIPDGLNEKSFRFTKLTRDADKLDIFFMLTETIRTKTLDKHKDLLWNLPIGEPNPSIVNKLMSGSQALYSEIKNATDVVLLQLCWLYGMNYDSSILRIKQNNTLELLASIVPHTDEITNCFKHMMDYIDTRNK